jgi:hypothetical protein
VDLTISIRQFLSSLALLNANASIPGMSNPAVPALFNVFAVEALALFRLVMIVVLGIVLIALLWWK